MLEVAFPLLMLQIFQPQAPRVRFQTSWGRTHLHSKLKVGLKHNLVSMDKNSSEDVAEQAFTASDEASLRYYDT